MWFTGKSSWEFLCALAASLTRATEADLKQFRPRHLYLAQSLAPGVKREIKLRPGRLADGIPDQVFLPDPACPGKGWIGRPEGRVKSVFWESSRGASLTAEYLGADEGWRLTFEGPATSRYFLQFGLSVHLATMSKVTRDALPNNCADLLVPFLRELKTPAHIDKAVRFLSTLGLQHDFVAAINRLDDEMPVVPRAQLSTRRQRVRGRFRRFAKNFGVALRPLPSRGHTPSHQRLRQTSPRR